MKSLAREELLAKIQEVGYSHVHQEELLSQPITFQMDDTIDEFVIGYGDYAIRCYIITPFPLRLPPLDNDPDQLPPLITHQTTVYVCMIDVGRVVVRHGNAGRLASSVDKVKLDSIPFTLLDADGLRQFIKLPLLQKRNPHYVKWLETCLLPFIDHGDCSSCDCIYSVRHS